MLHNNKNIPWIEISKGAYQFVNFILEGNNV